VQAKAQTRAIPLVVAHSFENAPLQRTKAVQFTDYFNELLTSKLTGAPDAARKDAMTRAFAPSREPTPTARPR